MASSLTTTDTYSEYGYLKYPYLSVKVIELRNLESFSENSQEFSPYIKFTRDSYSFKTRPKQTKNSAFYMENFDIQLDGFESLTCCLMDHDEFDGDIVISGVIFSIETLKQWKKGKQLWIKFSENDLSETFSSLEDGCLKTFTEDMEEKNPNNSKSPLALLEFTYFGLETSKEIQIEIISHETIIKDGEVFTEYQMLLARKDGMNWKVKFRYSQLREIRSKLIKKFREIKHLRFPSKTFTIKRKLKGKVVERRKIEIENFLNCVVRGQYQNHCKEFNEFLNLPDI
ncbi:unnamed protein product [Blepharisma stoltei]|uniref:C2 domain-containing protein n=1 Tax=Blepharisma stoltei TaxID=1481888 RepID=A0AAU9JL88_9CILI|nr:unnamed protein product [Blepharisma stoltei]